MSTEPPDPKRAAWDLSAPARSNPSPSRSADRINEKASRDAEATLFYRWGYGLAGVGAIVAIIGPAIAWYGIKPEYPEEDITASLFSVHEAYAIIIVIAAAFILGVSLAAVIQDVVVGQKRTLPFMLIGFAFAAGLIAFVFVLIGTHPPVQGVKLRGGFGLGLAGTLGAIVGPGVMWYGGMQIAPKVITTTKKCPDCAETILADAHICKHCGYRFTETQSAVGVKND